MTSRLSALRTVSTFGQVWASGLAFRLGLRSPHSSMLRPRRLGRIPSFSEQNVAQFIGETGGSVDLYRDSDGVLLVPQTYFATWALAELARVLHDAHLPLNFSHVVHAAATAKTYRLQRLDEKGNFVATVETVSRRADRTRIELQLVTSTIDDQPLAEYGLAVVLPGSNDKPRPRKTRSYERKIPMDSEPIASFHLPENEGWQYAKLSGDFNPIHWARPIAKLVGLKGKIAHGFDLMARVNHALIERLGAGNPKAVRCLDVAFRRPVVLPADLEVFVGSPMQQREHCARRPFWIGATRGTDANVVGRVELHV